MAVALTSQPVTTLTLPSLEGIPGFRDHFHEFLDPRSSHALFNTSRGIREALKVSAFSKSTDRFRALHGLLQGHHHILDLDQNGEISVIPLKEFFNRRGCFRKLLNRVVYYSGYHNYRMHQALERSDAFLRMKMQETNAECEKLQNASFVDLNLIRRNYKLISSLKVASRYLQLISGLQETILSHATQQCCRVVRAIFAALQARFLVRIARQPIVYCHLQAEDIKKSILEGYKTSVYDSPSGYPIGSTIVEEREDGRKVPLQATVYMNLFPPPRPGAFISLINRTTNKSYGCFTIERNFLKKELASGHEDPTVRTNPRRRVSLLEEGNRSNPWQEEHRGALVREDPRELFVWNFFWDDRHGERRDHQIMRRLIQVAVELFNRENLTTRRLSIESRDRMAPQLVSKGFSLISREGRTRDTLLEAIRAARREGDLYPRMVGEREEAFLYRDTRGGKVGDHPTQFFTSPTIPAQVQFNSDNEEVLTLEQYIEKEGVIFSESGDILQGGLLGWD